MPERTTPGGGRVAQPVLPAPPPPPGHGERLAAWGMTRYARWRELLAGLVIMVALGAPIVDWYRTPLSWVIAVCTIGPGWLLGIYAFPPRSIGVGADWLRVRSTRSDDWVQTNQLVRLALEIRWTNRYLQMEDRDGRKLRVDLDDLRANQRVPALTRIRPGGKSRVPTTLPRPARPSWYAAQATATRSVAADGGTMVPNAEQVGVAGARPPASSTRSSSPSP